MRQRTIPHSTGTNLPKNLDSNASAQNKFLTPGVNASYTLTCWHSLKHPFHGIRTALLNRLFYRAYNIMPWLIFCGNWLIFLLPIAMRTLENVMLFSNCLLGKKNSNLCILFGICRIWTWNDFNIQNFLMLLLCAVASFVLLGNRHVLSVVVFWIHNGCWKAQSCPSCKIGRFWGRRSRFS